MWIRRIFLLLLLLFLSSVYSQKLSEEEPVEGSANAISPDDEDFEEGSGLPPDEPVEHKPTSVKPNFVTEDHKQDVPVVVQPVATSPYTTSLRTRPPAKTIPITQKPADAGSATSEWNMMIILGIVAIVVIVILVIIIVVCCRKKSSRNNEYTQGTQRSKSHV